MAPGFVCYSAAATGSRLSLPAAGGTGHGPVGVWGSAKRSGASPSQTESAAPTGVFRESRKNEESGSFNLWLPDSCAIRRQQVAVGTADRQQVAVGTADRQRRQEFFGNPEKPKNPGASIYGSRIRVLSGGSNREQAQPADPVRRAADSGAQAGFSRPAAPESRRRPAPRGTYTSRRRRCPPSRRPRTA